jgi:hypothetical protein
MESMSEADQELSTKMAVFWVVAPCSLVEVYQRFRGPYCLHHQDDESPVSTSETWINSYQTTRRNIPEDCHLDRKIYVHWILCVEGLIIILG